MQVGSIMSTHVVAAKPEQTVREALRSLDELDVRHLPVVDRGQLVGMVSDRDLREYTLPVMEELENPDKAEDLLDTPLSRVMSGGVVSIDSFDSVRTAIDRMLEHRVGALPVLDPAQDELVGILSYVDVLAALREQI
ncbi:MAG: CBS domain-containing protein [Myxococcales bacterium FL481]|nr:MAG: CBS domain-containing protein [Myxococcales bacterium FL481]